MTKCQLIQILLNDNNPPETKINIYLECTNNDTGVYGEIIELSYDERFKELSLLGEYEEEE